MAFIPILIDKLQELEIRHLTSLSLFPSSVKVAVIVQLLTHVQFFATPWTAARQAPLSFTISRSLLRLMSIESVMPSNHLILCHPFPSCSQSFPAPGSFPLNWLSRSGGQNIGASASVSVFPMNIRGWFPLGLTGLISLWSKGLWGDEKLFIFVWVFPRSSPQNKDWG